MGLNCKSVYMISLIIYIVHRFAKTSCANGSHLCFILESNLTSLLSPINSGEYWKEISLHCTLTVLSQALCHSMMHWNLQRDTVHGPYSNPVLLPHIKSHFCIVFVWLLMCHSPSIVLVSLLDRRSYFTKTRLNLVCVDICMQYFS